MKKIALLIMAGSLCIAMELPPALELCRELQAFLDLKPPAAIEHKPPIEKPPIDLTAPMAVATTKVIKRGSVANLSRDKLVQLSCRESTCQRIFKTESEERNHYARMHRSRFLFECKECHERYSTRSSHDLHQMRKHGIKIFECKFCDKAYAVRGDLNQHMKRRHNTRLTL